MSAAISHRRRIPSPVVHYFKKVKDFRTVSHYDLTEVVNGTTLLTDKINIAEDRGFARSAPDYWLHIRPNSKWDRFSGLFKTNEHNVYLGDNGTNNRKRDVFVLRYSDNRQMVTVFYFRNFYTTDLELLLPYVNGEHREQKRVWQTTLF